MTKFDLTPDQMSYTNSDGVGWALMRKDSLARAAQVAEVACGDVLEIGLGLGYVHEVLHRSASVDSVTLVELHPEILNYYHNGCGCTALAGDWREVVPRLATEYDTVVMDTGERFDNLDLVLTQLSCVARTGGMIIISPTGDRFDCYTVGAPNG